MKRKVILLNNGLNRWKLRRTNEELEFFAEQYQMKKKYGDEPQELPEIMRKIMNLFEQSRQLAVQLRDMSS